MPTDAIDDPSHPLSIEAMWRARVKRRQTIAKVAMQGVCMAPLRGAALESALRVRAAKQRRADRGDDVVVTVGRP